MSTLVNKMHHDLSRWSQAWSVLEAASSLAHLSDRWNFNHAQTITSASLLLEDVGHPLVSIPYEVSNSLKIDDNNKIVLITGANMSGKSTILRSVAVNIILAEAGARVKAKRFLFPQCVLYSCISPRDSLKEGSSRFHAEVSRIKKVTDHWRKNKELCIFFIDEIFVLKEKRKEGLT